MSDEFLNEIDQAVAAKANPAPEPAKPDAPTPVTTNVNEKVQDDVLDMVMSDDERMLERETKQKQKREERKQKAEEEQSTDDAPEEEAPKEEPPKAKTEPETQQPRSYLDTFLSENEKGDLVRGDVVIAAAGEARQYFERMKNEGRQFKQAAVELAGKMEGLSKKFKDLYKDYEKVKDAPKEPLQTQLGMSNEEYTDAVATMKQLRNDPVSGIKKILTKAHARGIDLTSIVKGGGLDLPTVREILREELAAKQKEEPKPEPEEDTSQAERRIKEEIVEFIFKNPEAATEQNMQMLAQGKIKFPDATFEQLWEALTKVVKPKEEQQTKQDKPKSRPVLKLNKSKTLSVPSTDFSKMGYDEIAASIKEDYK